ncbi:MAG: chemotaxis response regulator protein-glutamate methylesterase [Nitrospirota bacterium]
MKKTIKVLIVDDSATVRQTMKKILESDPQIEVIGTAGDPFIAVKKMQNEVPDVIVLDVQMPRMDGITFLQKIMSQHPIPVVICSSLTVESSTLAIKALQYGAVDIIQKPSIGTKQFLEESKVLICDAVKAASRVMRENIRSSEVYKIEPKLDADSILAKANQHAMMVTTEKVVVVGASTGGTEALRFFLSEMPLDSPGIVVVQHMPENFTKAFANRLDNVCKISVKEAENGDPVLKGQALIAPGNRHILLKRSGTRYYVEVRDGPLVCRHRPSVDVLFRSASRYGGKNAIGVIMTGMGDDGARGMKEMKDAGSKTIAQDEQSCVVFGMPHEAIKLGGVDKVISLEAIPREVIRFSKDGDAG